VYSKPFALGEDDPSFPQPINAEPSTPARAQTVNFLENGFFIAKPVVIFSALKIIKHPHALQAFNAQKNELFMPRRVEKFLYVSRRDIWRIFLEHGRFLFGEALANIFKQNIFAHPLDSFFHSTRRS
jgi:hypothetical protein